MFHGLLFLNFQMFMLLELFKLLQVKIGFGRKKGLNVGQVHFLNVFSNVKVFFELMWKMFLKMILISWSSSHFFHHYFRKMRNRGQLIEKGCSFYVLPDIPWPEKYFFLLLFV